ATWPVKPAVAAPSARVAEPEIDLGPILEQLALEDEAALPPPEPRPLAKAAAAPLDLAWLPRVALVFWATASLVLALWQIHRVLRFRRALRYAKPAPEWLLEEAWEVGSRVGVRVPEILVVSAATTPLLWFLGRPKLLLPARLVATLDDDAWR